MLIESSAGRGRPCLPLRPGAAKAVPGLFLFATSTEPLSGCPGTPPAAASANLSLSAPPAYSRLVPLYRSCQGL